MKHHHRLVRAAVGFALLGTAFAGAVGTAGAVPSSTCTVTHNSDTGNGANTSGAYDSSCDGSASNNGNGGGNANGKPCAGCVGNADDKNPPGQAPDGSDGNNGYECDGNSGIGQTNPAHSDCDTGGGGTGSSNTG
jgi:hypothetical protein